MTQPLMRRDSAVDHRPWSLILSLLLVVTVGLIGLPLQVITYQQISQASKADQLRRGQIAICEQINDVVQQSGLRPTDCSKINIDR